MNFSYDIRAILIDDTEENAFEDFSEALACKWDDCTVGISNRVVSICSDTESTPLAYAIELVYSLKMVLITNIVVEDFRP